MGGSKKPKTTVYQGRTLGASTPNLFDAASKYMPNEYFGSSPIYNPESILNAYIQHMPEFLKATRPVVERAPSFSVTKGGGGGLFGGTLGTIMNVIDPVGSAINNASQGGLPIPSLPGSQPNENGSTINKHGMPLLPGEKTTSSNNSTNLTKLFPNIFPGVFNR